MTREEIFTRIDGCLDEMFLEFQNEHGIVSGDVPPYGNADMHDALYALAKNVKEVMDWQEQNAPRITYEQTYAPDTDTTFILKDTHVWDDVVRREVIGFYNGQPCYEYFEIYKTAGTVAEY